MNHGHFHSSSPHLCPSGFQKDSLPMLLKIYEPSQKPCKLASFLFKSSIRLSGELWQITHYCLGPVSFKTTQKTGALSQVKGVCRSPLSSSLNVKAKLQLIHRASGKGFDDVISSYFFANGLHLRDSSPGPSGRVAESFCCLISPPTQMGQ